MPRLSLQLKSACLRIAVAEGTRGVAFPFVLALGLDLSHGPCAVQGLDEARVHAEGQDRNGNPQSCWELFTVHTGVTGRPGTACQATKARADPHKGWEGQGAGGSGAGNLVGLPCEPCGGRGRGRSVPRGISFLVEVPWRPGVGRGVSCGDSGLVLSLRPVAPPPVRPAWGSLPPRLPAERPRDRGVPPCQAHRARP